MSLLKESLCPGCGLSPPARDLSAPRSYYNTSAEYWDLYTEVLGNEYSNANLFGQIHQLTVDSYAVQHAGGPHPDKSVDVHLFGLYLSLERGIRSPSLFSSGEMDVPSSLATISGFAANPTRTSFANTLKAYGNHRITFPGRPFGSCLQFHLMTDKFHLMTEPTIIPAPAAVVWVTSLSEIGLLVESTTYEDDSGI